MDSDEHSNQHWAATWIFALTTLSLFTIVLIVAPFLSADAKHSISYEVVYWYELVLMFFAIIAMVVIAVYAMSRKKNDDSDVENRNGTTCTCNCSCSYACLWAVFKVMAKYMEPVAIVLCGIGSVILLISEISSIYDCVDMAIHRIYVVRVVSLVFIVVFSLLEIVWLLLLQRRIKFIDVTKWQNAIAIMFIILGNLVLCVRCFVDTVRASKTLAYVSRTDYMPQHFFDVTLVFSKCSNDTEIVDNGNILRVFRFTYTFPFQFGFLALKFIFSVFFNNENEMDGQNNEEKENPRRGVTLLKISKWSNVLSPVIVLVFFISYAVLEGLSGTLKNVDESANGSEYVLAFHVIYLVHAVFYSGPPSFTLYWLLKCKVKSKLDFNKCLLMFFAIGNIFFCLFEIVDSSASANHIADGGIRRNELIYIVTLVIRIIGIYSQMIVIFDSHGFLDHETFLQNKQVCSYVRAILIFLAYDNGVRWLLGTILPAPALTQVYQIKEDDSFGDSNWWLIVKLFTPLVLLYRLLASMMCFELAARMKYIKLESNNDTTNVLQDQSNTQTTQIN